jgi:hypothetical protein
VAIAWAGIHSAGRIAAAVASVVLVWFAPALLTAAASALGTRALARDPAGMLEYGVGVLRMALFIPELALRPVVATVIVAVAGLVLRAVIARQRGAGAARSELRG